MVFDLLLFYCLFASFLVGLVITHTPIGFFFFDK